MPRESPLSKTASLHLTCGSFASPAHIERRTYAARFVRAGAVRAAGNHPSDTVIESAALGSAVERGLFEARPVFLDHAGLLEYPSLQNLVGVTQNVTWDEASGIVLGEIRLYDSPLALFTSHLIDQILSEEHPPDIGLSMVFYPQWGAPRRGDTARRIVGIDHIESIDLVFEPAADGRILHALSALNLAPASPSKPSLPHAQTTVIQTHPHPSQGDNRMSNNPTTPSKSSPLTPPAADSDPASAGSQSSQGSLFDGMYIPASQLLARESAVPPSPNEPASSGSPMAAEDTARAWEDALAKSAVRAMIHASDLPPVSQAHLLSASYASPAEVHAAIENERTYLSQLQENNVVQ